MSFDKHSNFNKQSNFTEVKFGENKPVLEVELNELQQIQNEARADIVRDTIPSGFTKLGEIDYDFCLNNENQIKFKTESVAYVNGYRINIPKDTIVNIGKAPEKDAREDLVFLEVWKEEVNSTSTLYKEGGEGQASIPNNIKDSRYPIETTHRVALRWRIRHVADVDFNRYHMDGFSAGTNGRNSQVTAQGGSDKPFTPTFDTDATGSFNRSDLLHLNDKGLFVTSQNAELFKTFDGYVYAIPMFRLYRKPSCGKSIPFEYDKINPKVDYSKFTKLIQDEKVERVHSENIKGRSLVNLGAVGRPYFNAQNPSQFTSNEYSNDSIKRGTVVSANVNNVTGWKYLGLGLTNISCLKYDTNYTVMFKSKGINSNISIQICDSSSTNFLCGANVLAKDGVNLVNFKTTSNTSVTINNQIIYFALGENHLSTSNQPIVIGDVILIEGTLTQPVEYFEGLKSLGEDDENLITIKNGILNDDTYDINDGNQKLLAFSEVTHINSTNTIIPTIEANVIKGEESTPLEKLGSKLETEGHEVIEFTKIKGKTLQNLVNLRNKVYSVGSTIDSQITPALKSNTWYTLIIQINNNTLNKPVRLSGYNLVGGQGEIRSESDFAEDTNIFNVGENGTWKGKFSILTFGSDTPSLTLFSDNATSGSYVASAMLLEGDHTNTPLEELPFVEGIKSLGENEGNIINIQSIGKNLCPYNDVELNARPDKPWVDMLGNEGIYGASVANKTNTWFYLAPGNYSMSYEQNSCILQLINKQEQFCDLNNFAGGYVCVRLKSTSTSGKYSIHNLQIQRGELTSYEPYQEYKQEIHLKEPLRSLPNGVCDEIVGNKVIRGVGQDTFTGSTIEDWKEDTSRHLEKTLYFEIPKVYNIDRSIRCSHFPTKLTGDSASVWNTDSEVCNYDNFWNMLVIRINRSRLATQDLAGFKKWLSENNVTVVHGLVKEIEEPLVNVYEKESIKTYQLDAPLRSLPNGVKDEIKDGVLIRRCGEILLDGSETWKDLEKNSNFVKMSLSSYPLDMKYGVYGYCDKFNFMSDQGLSSMTREYISSTTDSYFSILLSISATKLTSQDYTGFKAWLRANPVKVIYQLATPTETILTESKPQNANFSLQRQFGEGNWLRELPNGVKDTVENGKVIRRTTKLNLKGSELWELHSNNTTEGGTLYRYFLPLNTTSAIGTKQDILICDKLKVVNDVQQEIWSCENIHYRIDNNRAGLYIVKNNITTLQDFKSWLTNNPVSIITLLATPTEEELTNENCNYFPSHEFNTYCGSMYVGEGRNYVISDTKMPSEDTIVVETDFREIEGKAKVEDCNFKKNDEGYDTMCLLPTNKNLFDGIWEKGMINTDGSIAETQSTTRKYSKNFIRVIPGKTYIFSANLGEDRINLKGYDLNKKLVHNFGYSAKHTIPEGCYFVRFYNGHDSSVNLDNIKAQFELGETATSYVEGINTFRSFENTEENDIDDLRHQVSLTGFNYDKILNESFDKLLRGEL